MYPIRFENLYFEKIWGGRALDKFRENLPDGLIGESWDIACHPNGTGIVENGYLKGKRFNELIELYGEEFLGKNVDKDNFPLLIKLINSREKLSVQVHPGDEYAKKNENQLGKTEAWYIVDAEEGAYIIVGIKPCTKDEFKNAIEEGNVEEYLNKVPVKKGDAFLINSGLVHAICEGVVIAEIQQNSDVTYRVYDYGRPREIHVEKALDVINFNEKSEKIQAEVTSFEGYTKEELCSSDYFVIERYKISSEFNEESNQDRFEMITIVEGSGEIINNNYIIKVATGDSILIPACIGKYKVRGELTILKSYPSVK